MESKGLMKILAMIGGIVAFIEAIVGFFGWGFYGWGIFSSIVALILAIIVLLSVFRPDNPIPYNAIFLIIFGILMIVFSSLIGGILVLIGGIIGFINK